MKEIQVGEGRDGKGEPVKLMREKWTEPKKKVCTVIWLKETAELSNKLSHWVQNPHGNWTLTTGVAAETDADIIGADGHCCATY